MISHCFLKSPNLSFPDISVAENIFPAAFLIYSIKKTPSFFTNGLCEMIRSEPNLKLTSFIASLNLPLEWHFVISSAIFLIWHLKIYFGGDFLLESKHSFSPVLLGLECHPSSLLIHIPTASPNISFQGHGVSRGSTLSHTLPLLADIIDSNADSSVYIHRE